MISTPLIHHSEDAVPPALPVSLLVDASGAGCGPCARSLERRSEGQGTNMIRASAEIREGELTYRVCVTAPSIECALGLVREVMPGHRVRLIFPLDPDVFFVPEESRAREEAA
jgi:hypothetical protein